MVCKNLSLSGCIRAQAKEIDGVLMYPQNFGEYSGAARARSHCCCAPPHIHFIPDLLTYSVPLFLKRQCDRTLGAHPDVQTLEGQTCLHFAALWQHVEVAEPLARPRRRHRAC